MGAPVWLAATAGVQGYAGQVNQFLTSHAATYVWTGALQDQQRTAGSGTAASNGLWIAQSFTLGASQPTVGYAMPFASASGSPGTPWAVSLQADSGGAPSGTALASGVLPQELAAAPTQYRTVLLPATGLTAGGTYWIVAEANGDSSNYFFWDKSNQTSGVSTSTDGVTWTPQSYGLLFQVYDLTQAGPLVGVYEDSGARTTALAYSAAGLLTGIGEYTAGQTATGYAASERALSYSGYYLTGAA